jgi:hypothetical protein
MTRISEQKALLDDLYYVSNKMSRSDYDAYQVFLKRQKDDEDFDIQSFANLESLHKKYVIKKKPDLESLFKKPLNKNGIN